MSAILAEPLYETSDLARHFGVSAAAVQKWTRQGLISPRRTVGGRRLFTQRDIEELERLRGQRAANARHAPGVAA